MGVERVEREIERETDKPMFMCDRERKVGWNECKTMARESWSWKGV